MAQSFGDSSHYYAEERERKPRSDSEEANFLWNVLGSEADDLKRKVERAESRWSRRTQDLVRTETKLKLTYDGKSQPVPVTVEDGVPPPFAEVLREHPDLQLWLLLRNRGVLETTDQGLRLVSDHVERLKEAFPLLREHEDVHRSTFLRVQSFINDLLRVLEEGEIVDSVSSIPVDVLGAYFFRVPRIHLYWMPIALIARMLNVSVDALTAVVLLHERVHAYTHHGFDTDGEQWDTEAFAQTQLPVVEGLAQYYTHVICHRIQEKRPAVREAYDALLQYQPAAYKVHLDWEPNQPRAGEVVRNTLILSRARPIKDYDHFLDTLEKSWNDQGQWKNFAWEHAMAKYEERVGKASAKRRSDNEKEDSVEEFPF
jgi:hypothetical protein